MKKLYLLFLILHILFSCKKENTPYEIFGQKNYYEKAKKFRDTNVSDSAFYYYNLAKNDFLERNDSVGAAKSLVNMAIIQTNNGDFYGGTETSLEANRLLKKSSDSIVKSMLAANYNNLGIASSFLKNYTESAEFYKKALQFATTKENKLTYYNNLADVLLLQGKPKQAKAYLKFAVLAKDSISLARALNNLGKAKFFDDKNYNPLPELNAALEIRQNKGDIRGKNSSYATLSDYYLSRDRKKSLYFANKLLQTANTIKIPDDQIEALQRIIFLDSSNYLKNFRRLTQISDSLQTARNKAKNQFAIIRYDVEKLKADKAQKEIQVLQQSIGLSVLAVTLIVGFFWNERRKRNIRREKEQEKQLEVKNTELKYSKKVHDVVANGLYHLMIEIENNPEINRNKLLNDLEKMYEESRDISHESLMEQNFFEKFGKMINSYSTPEQKVLPAKYTENIWDSIPQYIQAELFYVVREILVNMKKHSEAKLAVLKFERNDTSLRIIYSDNGNGIENLGINKGTGIQNTENRIAAIGGDIIFEQNPNGGLIIKITIPINSKYV